MSRRPKLICFDWDGTLIDSINKIAIAMVEAGVSMGCKRIHPRAIENNIGMPFEELITKFYGDINVDLFIKTYNEVYLDLPPAPLFPGTIELIHRLKHGFLLAIITNKSRKLLEVELKQHNLQSSFHSFWVADEYSAKPSPIMLQFAIGAHHVTSEETWLIGDSLADYHAGQNAKIAKIVLININAMPAWADNVDCVQSIQAVYQLFNQPVYE